jgi:hypothetical protein
MVDMAATWGDSADDFVTIPIAQSDKLPQEEQPDAVTKALLDFLEPWEV